MNTSQLHATRENKGTMLDIIHKRTFTVMAAVIALLIGAAISTVPAAPARADTTSNYKKQIFDNTNNARKTAGKQYLNGSDHLNKIAQDWANYMASTGDYKHNPNVATQTRATAGWTWAGGENIAAGQKDGNAVYTTWWNSPGHKANLLHDNYNRIGIGVAFGGPYGVYYVQVFGYNTGADPISYIYGDAPGGTPTGTLINKGDIVARDSAGKLWNYGNLYKPGTTKKLVSTGWNSMRDIVVTDFNADGIRDIVANSKIDGKLYLYVGKKTGGFNAKKAIGTSGWSNLELHIAKMKKTDKYPSIITRTPTGDLNLYKTANGSSIAHAGKIGTGWKSFRSISVAYFDNNDNIDVIAETTAGNLILYRTNGATFVNETRKTVGNGWSGFTSVSQMNVHGTNSSGYAAIHRSTGRLFYYPMSGNSGFNANKVIGSSGWSTFYVAKQTL